MDEFYRTLKKQSCSSRRTIPDMSAETRKKKDLASGLPGFEAGISRNASLWP
jgi:hypothetical protein